MKKWVGSLLSVYAGAKLEGGRHPGQTILRTLPARESLLPTLDALDTEYLIAVAREAGAAILEVYATDFEVERKSDASPLTEADLRAHRVIVARLSERYPDIPILSEESGEHDAYERRKEWDRFWLVDPLDGTKEFIKRNGQFTVNIALIEDGRPRAGVVYAPALDLLYWGEVEQGAFKKEAGGSAVALGPPTHKPREKLIIAGSLSHPTPEMDAFLDEQHALYKEVEFVAMGSSLKLCMVADGSADVYPRFGPTMEWDTAAAHAVVNAAGRKVLRHGSDEELRYNKPDLHNDWFLVR